MRPWELKRRTLLGGAAALVGLPVLEAMLPSMNRAYAAGMAPPRRFVTFGFPTGVNHAKWDVTGTGANYTLSSSLSPLADFKSDFSVLKGINNDPANGPRGHTCGIAAFLTCKRIPQTDPDVHVSISADQVAANYLKQFTRIPSIELSTSVLHEVPNAEGGFSPAYKNVVSWRDETSSLPFEVVPQAAFDRLFGGMDTNASAADAQKRLKYRQSVLDAVKADATRLNARLGKSDQHKVDQYMTGLRELESRIQANPQTAGGAGSCTPGTRPGAGQPADIRDRVKQMLDIIVLALQCDVTRVATFFYENTVTDVRHDFLGVTSDYHIGVTHHGGDAKKLEDYATVNKWLVSQLAYLLGKMKAITEPDGTLLDNSVVFFSSEISDGDAHSHSDLPIVLAGKGGGMLNPGRAVQYNNAKVANLFIKMLSSVGVDTGNKFGDDGDGPLPNL